MSDLRVLVIDDMRVAKEPGAVHAQTPSEGVLWLQGGAWDVICLDHDMGYNEDGDELTIRPVMEYIEKNAERFCDTLFYVVTSNPYAERWMKNMLINNGLDVIVLSESEKVEMFDYRSWEDLTGY